MADSIPIEKKDPKERRGGARKNGGSGGFRPGAGRKKGSKNAKTLAREEAVAELAEAKLLKKEIYARLPHNLQRSEKALQAAIKEISEEEVEDLFKKRVALHSNAILNSLMNAALGEKYLYKIVMTVGKNGKSYKKHVRVTDPEEIQYYLDNPLETENETYYYISTKEPDINAANSLIDRFMGRPTTKVVGPKGPDGEEGPIKVIVANFAGNQVEDAANAGHIAGNIVKEVIEEQEELDGNK